MKNETDTDTDTETENTIYYTFTGFMILAIFQYMNNFFNDST